MKGLQPPTWAQDSTATGKGHHTVVWPRMLNAGMQGAEAEKARKEPGGGARAGRGQGGAGPGRRGVAVPVGEATLFFSGRQGRQSDFYLGQVSLCLSPSLIASV